VSEWLEVGPSGSFQFDRCSPSDEALELESLRRALERSPREIPSKYFYDEAGARLFDEICTLPEYYPTRVEHEILRRFAPAIAGRTRAAEIFELGSGSSAKTRLLLDAFHEAGSLRTYLPFDVNEASLRSAGLALARDYRGLAVHAFQGDFARDLDRIPMGKRRLAVFLGGTIGNFRPSEAVRFLTALAGTLSEGDHLLLGTDLVKDTARIEAAYNDSAGVTAEFNRNILRVVNRALDANFVPDAFEHRAFFDEDHAWIEMRLVSRGAQTVFSRRLGWELGIRNGEEILTEISAKFDRPRVESLLERSGFTLVDWFTDPEDLFGLALGRRTSAPAG
jgi:L-histidine N-alpha-methyltransferase